MPFYHAIVKPELLSEPERQAFANDVVRVHCGATGAPPSFVHVLVTDDQHGRLGGDLAAQINGTIRAGRTEDQKAEIIDGLCQAMAERAGVAADSVAARTRDIEASFTMEGGQLLPEPGSAEEEAWKAAG